MISDEKKNKLAQDLIYFFEKEKGEKIGMVFATTLIDFFIEELGDDIYNRAISDSSDLIKNKFEDLELDLDNLKK